MEKHDFKISLNDKEIDFENCLVSGEICYKIAQPITLRWQPKEDITTYELALCMPYLLYHGPFVPHIIDKTLPHFRHFEIIDPNIE